jgi:hypothetical protein
MSAQSTYMTVKKAQDGTGREIIVAARIFSNPN